VHPDEKGRLRYVPDYRGNHIPDFSTAGYRGGGIKIPDVPVRVRVDPGPGDDTDRIQDAIDYVSSLDPDGNGIRGAVLLSRGVFEIGSFIQIRQSGVVLRGEGSGDYRKTWLDPSLKQSLEVFKNGLANIDATLLIATGNARRTLVRIGGEGGPVVNVTSGSEIIEEYVPVGSKSFRINDPGNFSAGDRIIIQRSGNAEWISAIGMDTIPQSPVSGGIPTIQWTPFNLQFENTITAVAGNLITTEAPVFNAVEKKWGGGRIYKYTDEGRISDAGIENLRAISFWVPDDLGIDHTRHADRFLQFDNIRDGWVLGVALEHFYASGGAINISRTSGQITIRNTSNLIAGPRFLQWSRLQERQDKC
jgi:hypothetical protein